jgi:hypothetical protein
MAMAMDGTGPDGVPVRRALVLGGTGMLAGCTATLVAEGWHVVVPSRRHFPISAAAFGDDLPQRALWVATDWLDPVDLAERAGRALGGPAELLVAWVHSEYRESVLKAVAPLLTPDAPVVEVHGSAAADPLSGCPDPVLPDHPTQQVVLGLMRVGESTRWLNHAEVSDGVLAAVRRALAGRPATVFQVGEAPLAFQRT